MGLFETLGEATRPAENDKTAARIAFEDRLKRARNQIETIRVRLCQMDLESSQNEKSWGYAGSMGHVNDELSELIKFLGG